MTTQRVSVRLPRLFGKQAEIRDDPALRKVLVCGRQFGKTLLASDAAVELAMQGRRVLYAAPTATQTNQFWDYCKAWLEAPIDAKIIHKNETDRILQFLPTANGLAGRIRCQTAWNADTLRGGHEDLLMLDEFAYMDEEAWGKVGAPMLLRTNGAAWFISTPRRRNHFYRFYQRALRDGVRWKAWHCTSLENKHLSTEALEEITRDMTQDDYRQEILAEFLEDSGSVFHNIENCTKALPSTPAEHPGHTIVAGIDWGRTNDYTAISVVCADCMREVDRARFRLVDALQQLKRIKEMVGHWHIRTLVPEQNSIGQPMVDMMNNDPFFRGVYIQPVMLSGKSKPALIRALVLCFEHEDVQWIQEKDDLGADLWTEELRAYEETVSEKTGVSTYSAPSGGHDDTVIARVMAYHAVQIGGPAQIMDTPFWS